MTAAAINDGVAGAENGSIPELRVIMSRRSTKKMALKHEQVSKMGLPKTSVAAALCL